MLSDLRASRISCLLFGLASLGMVTGCARSPLRAVVEIATPALSYELDVSSGAAAPQEFGVAAADKEPEPMLGREMSQAMLQVQLSVASELTEAGPVAKGAPLGDVLDSEIMGSGSTQLDPQLGPMDLGYPLLVDLGAGEAPYDDGVRTIHSVEFTRGGFSDSVLQAAWRESVTRNSLLHLTVAFSRYQDLGILDGLEDTEFSWCVLGWKTSF